MTYRFGRFTFDRDRGLVEAGKPVPLEPQVLDLLAYLLENRDRVITKDELNERIWGGRAVSDAALSTRIRAVRRALGDDRSQQKFIRTHPKRGFQFVATVEADDAGDDDREATPPPPEPPRQRGVGRYLFTALLGIVAIVIAAALAGRWIEPAGTAGSGPPPKLSIAVMPFDNLSGDPDQDYFVDAFTEDLITDLSRIRDAFVIARRTSFTYKNRSIDARTAAEELNVRYILEGSVQRSGDRVRINAQLIDGETNSHVWSERYDRELTDAFSVQSDVTGQIASALKAELRAADLERQGPPESLKAWDYALKGNVLLVRPNRDFSGAYRLLQKAITLDPSVASAWAGLAFVYYVASLRPIPGVDVENPKAKSLEAAQKAVALDPKNAEGHWMVGVGYARNGQTTKAWASCETAMDLNPNNDCAYVCAGLTKMAMGEPAEAIPFFERSLRLNPRFRPFTKYKYMGLAYVQAGQDAKAIEVVNRALANAPNDTFSHLILAAALALSGRVEEARTTLEEALQTAGNGEPTIAKLRENQSWMGPGFDRILEGLRRAGLAQG